MVEGIVGTVVGGILLAGLVFLAKTLGLKRDQRRVLKWLERNTEDEPGSSHVTLSSISNGVCLPEKRVRKVCVSCPRILRSQEDSTKWSIWREEPQSVYDKRRVREV